MVTTPAHSALGYGPFVSAAIAGGLLSIINTPVGLVKVQEQVMPVDKKSSTLKRARAIFNGPKPIRVCHAGMQFVQKGDRAERIEREERREHELSQYLSTPARLLQSLYTGFGVNLVSESYGRGVYMWVYDWMKRYLAEPSATGELDLNVTNLSLGKVRLDADRSLPVIALTCMSPEKRLFARLTTQRVIAAASAGVSSWFVIYPLDVIKSRMQSAPILRGTPYKNTMDCVRQVRRQPSFPPPPPSLPCPPLPPLAPFLPVPPLPPLHPALGPAVHRILTTLVIQCANLDHQGRRRASSFPGADLHTDPLGPGSQRSPANLRRCAPQAHRTIGQLVMLWKCVHWGTLIDLGSGHAPVF